MVKIGVSGMNADDKRRGKLQVLDQNGANLTDDALEYLTFYNISQERMVDVSVKLWRIVDNIKVTADYSGTPAYGYQVDKITTTPETISVAGSEEALRKLKENNNTIEIPASQMNVEGLKQDLENNIKLSSLLKEEDGYKIPEDSTQSVMVKVSILPYGSKEFAVSTDDIKVIGLADNLRLSFSQDTVTVRVKANASELEALTESQIQASVDLTDRLEGEHTLPVNIVLPDGYELVESTVATVQLSKVENTTRLED